jgi:CheY-like chemotaxis protein
MPPLRVLVADDVNDIVESLRLLLELWGHDVRTARDGAEAVAVAATFRPHVALLDIIMPRMHGAEAARNIRQRDPDVAVFALSATARDHPLLSGYAGVFDDFLGKPLNPGCLQRLLARLASARE